MTNNAMTKIEHILSASGL